VRKEKGLYICISQTNQLGGGYKQTNKMITVHELQQDGGTSFFNYTISTSINRLTELFGEAMEIFTDIDDKVQYEWVLETSEGTVFTIYDWKEYRELSMFETIEFHIGSHSPRESHIAWQELLDLI
jgi:hypothetical protein